MLPHIAKMLTIQQERWSKIIKIVSNPSSVYHTPYLQVDTFFFFNILSHFIMAFC